MPIARPLIRDGWVAVARGRIIDLGSGAPQSRSDAAVFAESAILPGLVNAHVHLELSWMAGKVPPADSMPAWVARLIALQRTVASGRETATANAVRDVRASGTTLVGEVTNTLAAYDALVDSELSAAIFRELLGFSVEDPNQIVADAAAEIAALTPIGWLRPGVVPHAPYSVSPALFQTIGRAASRKPMSVHLGESAEEIQFLRDGTGPWRELLRDLNVWNDGWCAPGCGPVEYLARLGLLNEQLIAVHAVQLTDDDLRALAAAQATVVTCPRSNQWTGAGAPPVERFYASGVRVAIGTDSLASVADLQMFNELAAVRALAPRVPPARLLESATRHGADALGFGDELGTIEPGKRAELIAVTIPPNVEDVEEYLVSGQVKPADIRWLETERFEPSEPSEPF